MILKLSKLCIHISGSYLVLKILGKNKIFKNIFHKKIYKFLKVAFFQKSNTDNKIV